MSKSIALLNLDKRNSLLNTILTICICGLIVLIFSIISYLLYRLLKHTCINRLSQDITSDDKQLWINDNLLRDIRYISRTHNAYKLIRIRDKRKPKVCILSLIRNNKKKRFSNIIS
jgi:hypothetical protein